MRWTSGTGVSQNERTGLGLQAGVGGSYWQANAYLLIVSLLPDLEMTQPRDRTACGGGKLAEYEAQMTALCAAPY